jgi:hypothetical protein
MLHYGTDASCRKVGASLRNGMLGDVLNGLLGMPDTMYCTVLYCPVHPVYAYCAAPAPVTKALLFMGHVSRAARTVGLLLLLLLNFMCCHHFVPTGQTVLVLGASGGVGVAAVQIAKVQGAQVIAVTQVRSLWSNR